MYNKIFKNKTALQKTYFLAMSNFCDFDLFCDNLLSVLDDGEKVIDVRNNLLITNFALCIDINEII